MARGMVVGEAIVSQASTKAFDEGAERIGLGKSERAKERGRFVWDPKANGGKGGLVRPWEVDRDETAMALHAPIRMDRFMENTGTVDGEDIGSRRKRKDYMRRTGLVDANEAHEAGRDERKRAESVTARNRREAVARELERVILMPEERYRKELKARERERLARGERGLE